MLYYLQILHVKFASFHLHWIVFTFSFSSNTTSKREYSVLDKYTQRIWQVWRTVSSYIYIFFSFKCCMLYCMSIYMFYLQNWTHLIKIWCWNSTLRMSAWHTDLYQFMYNFYFHMLLRSLRITHCIKIWRVSQNTYLSMMQ